MVVFPENESLFDAPAGCLLVCPVNTLGVMGAGLALEFSHREPEASRFYRARCRGPGMYPGEVVTYGRVVFAATKQDWRRPSRLEWVESCLWGIRKESEARGVRACVPALGAGLGGLPWEGVLKLVEEVLGPSKMEFRCYGPR